jgi:hypothetical protein
MARKTIKTVHIGRCIVRIQRDAEWNEFVVATKAPVKKWTGTYHTEDKQDARNTAAQQIKMLRRAGVCRW